MRTIYDNFSTLVEKTTFLSANTLRLDPVSALRHFDFLVSQIPIQRTWISFWVIDKYGRKPLYMIGSLGMAFSLSGLAIAAFTGRFHGPVVLAFILTYLAFFASCIGPVFWTLLPEIFPNDVRGMAMTIPVLVQWVANALIVLFFPFAFHVIGKTSTFGFLALMCLVQGLFTWKYLPETKNKHLEEIERYWQRPRAPQAANDAR